MGEEGQVVLRVQVEANGRPAQIELKSSSSSPRLDQAAQDAVWRWKFIPAKRGDEAIGAWVLVPITFTLKN
jgi:protein TonB